MSREKFIPIGTRFGRLLVEGMPKVEECGIAHNGKYTYIRKRKLYPCICDCGTRKFIEGSKLLCGDVGSCGCKRREMYENNRRHNTVFGSWDTPLFKVWRAMIRRCHSPKAPNRKYYYDRGIKVCQRWREDFSDFKKWADDNGYEKGLQIDRIDVNGNYEPSNCRWITPKANAHNRSNHAEVIYKGEKRNLVDVMDEVGSTIDIRTVWKRIFLHKWDIGRALTEEKHYEGKRGRILIKHKGHEYTTTELANLTGLSPKSIRHRLFKQHMTIEQAIVEPRKTHKKKGDRIAQFVVAPVTRCEPVEVSEVSDSERGKGGFGSSGV